MTARRPRRPAFVAAALGLAGALLALAACEAPPPEASREALLDRAARAVAAEVSDAVVRGRAAVEGAARALDAAGADRLQRFDALEAVRAATRVDGLYWGDPGGEGIWAGTPLVPPDLPEAPPPWAASFSSGDVTWHAGPFLRAVLVTASGDRPGVVRATVVLGAAGRRPNPYEPSVEARWAQEHRVRAVRVLPPEVLGRPGPPGVRRVPVAPRADGTPSLAVEVEPPAEEVVAALRVEGRRRQTGWVGLGAVAAGALAAWGLLRWLARSAAARAGCLAAVVLLARHALRLLDLPGRFPEWGAAFRTTHFGMTGYLGWLATPGDLALTCAALLGAASLLARAAVVRGTPSTAWARVAVAAAGALAASAAARAWLFLVEAASAHGQVDLSSSGSLVPSLPRALLLSGLVLATGGAWVLARAGLRAVAACAGPRGRVPAAAAAAAAAVLVAWGGVDPSRPLWAAALLPAAALVAGRLRPDASRLGPPSRILLLSVLATGLLFPLLWRGAEDTARAALEARVQDLVTGRDSARSGLRLWLEPLLHDHDLVRSLERQAQGGPASEGLAIHAWKRLHFDAGRRDEGAVYVYDAQDRRFDRFGLNTPPMRRLPEPQPNPESDEDAVTVVGVPAQGDRLAATVGRARIRSPEGRVLGTVGVVMPDPLYTAAAGLPPRLTAPPPEESPHERRDRPTEIALVRDGRVVLSTDPTLPRETAPPVDLSGVRQPSWVPAQAGGPDWLAVPAGERGVVLARFAPGTLEDLLFGLARVSVVGVGLGTALAALALLALLPRFRLRLRDRILLAYVVVSAMPLVALGWTNWADALARAEEEFRDRQEAITTSARREIERLVGDRIDYLQSTLTDYAELRGLDLSLYEDGEVLESSLRGLVDAELLPRRLDASVFRATEIEGRDFHVREEPFAGRTVRVAYAPLRNPKGRPVATLSVPLLFDNERAEQRAAESGSVLLAAYLLALVLVVVVAIGIARRLARPIDRLVDGTRRVAAGELETQIPGAGRDEMGSLVASFNRMIEDLKRAREQAARAEREHAWRGMARQIAHEIKNPLTPMKLMLQQLQATARSDPAMAAQLIEPAAKVVLEQVDALSRIASDFAAFARFPSRDLREVDVNEVLRAVALLHSAGEAAPAQVETDLASGLPPVRWDVDEIRRVFVNLVANAVQAADEAKGRVRVLVRSRAAAEPGSGRPGVLVVVHDDGVGIPPEHRARLFEPYFSTKSHGTGLGLAIVRRVVADLGGDVRIDSEPGRGTTVSVWMPAATPTAQGAPPASPPPA